MVPMAIETGQNAPLGRAVIGGLVLATWATLFFVPTLFSVFHRRGIPRAATVAPDETQLAAHLEVKPS
jgi:Cu/Ag efflux pump CusA